MIDIVLAAIVLISGSGQGSFYHEENAGTCWDDGYKDGKDNPFNQDRHDTCEQYDNMYYEGFIAGCMSADNSREICDKFTDA